VVSPTVAIPVLLLLQVPPAEVSLNAVVIPIHTVAEPITGPGNGFTVTVVAV
jgi:hypothetical protein